jgi:peptidoglycan hydrolase CwlO-like protein
MRKHTVIDENSSLGWISTTDVVLIVLVASVAIAASWSDAGNQLTTEYAVLQQDNQKIQEKVKELQEEQSLLLKKQGKLLDDINQLQLKHQAELSKYQQEIQQLKKLNLTLIANVKEMQDQVLLLNNKLTAIQQQYSDLKTRHSKLKTEYDELALNHMQISLLQKKLTDANEAIAKLTAKNKDLISNEQSYIAEVARLKDEIQELKAESAKNNIARDLLGLKGKLQRVAIVLDTSTSMLSTYEVKGPNPYPDIFNDQLTANPWDAVVQVSTTWIKQLQMQECILITYDKEVNIHYPNDNQIAAIKGSSDLESQRRQKLIDIIKTIKIEQGKGTNTRAALQAAYDFNPDTIILFTDGAPNTGNEATLVLKEAQEIVQMLKPNVPINAIGMGNYFDPDLANFLRAITIKSNGHFFGR